METNPPDLVLAIVTVETWPPLEPPYKYPRKQSTPPKPQPWRDHQVSLVNRGDQSLDVAYSTSGFASFDDDLVKTSTAHGAAQLGPRGAKLVETADDGAFDFTFCYVVRVRRPGDSATWQGTFGVSRWGRSPLDTYEHDPVLGTDARVIRVEEWSRVS